MVQKRKKTRKVLKINARYIPKNLTKKDKKKQLSMLLKSRNLYYGKKDEFHINHIINNNNNIIPHHPEGIEAALSFCCLVNMIKCNKMSIEYEFVKGHKNEWNFGKSNQKMEG